MPIESDLRPPNRPPVPRGGCRPTGRSRDVLREHAIAWLEEWRVLGSLKTETDQIESELRERMKSAMHRASTANRLDPDTDQDPPLAARQRARLRELRAQIARRDVLQARRDLSEVERSRKALEHSMRDVLARVRQLETMLGESIEIDIDGEGSAVQQIG